MSAFQHERSRALIQNTRKKEIILIRISRLNGYCLFCVHEKGGKEPLSPSEILLTVIYWNTVGMLLVLLASFASPKWH